MPTRRLVGLAAIGLLAVSVSACSAMLDRSATLRALWWRDADMGDIDRFARRDIANRAPEFEFHLPTPNRYDTLFTPLTFEDDGVEVEQDFDDFLELRDTYSFLVVRRDTLVYEAYFGGRDRHSVETTFSVSKSLVSLATGLAIDQGWIESIQEPITTYLPELAARDSEFEDVTVGHLLTMTSGIEFGRGKTPWGDEARSYYAPDLRSVALGRSLAEPPGTRFLYNFYSPIVLGLVLERASGRSLSEILAESIWTRIGATQPASWSLDSERSGFEKMESGFNAAAIDLAKLGRLYLRQGDWDGEQLVSPAWIQASVLPDSANGGATRYGYYWHLDAEEPDAPRFWAEGRFGQFVYVAPHQDLVIVRTGETSGDLRWPSLFNRLVNRIDAVDAPDGNRPE